MRISKKRAEMGEEKWRVYQINKRREKYRKWMDKNRDKIKQYNNTRANYAVCWRARAKEKLIEYKGGRCCQCGYDKNVPRAYEFHHRDPSQKEFTISKYSVLNIEKLKKEVDKCDLLCRNCHAEIHDEKYRVIRKLMKEKHDQYMDSRTSPKIVKCGNCFEEFEQLNSKQMYCSTACSDIKKRKVINRPNVAELKSMIDFMPWTKIGEKYGVSDNAVRKWARKYGLIK